MRGALFAAVVLVGCGRLEFARLAPVDAETPDGDPDPFACDPGAPFQAPVPIAELNSATEIEGTLRLFPDKLRGPVRGAVPHAARARDAGRDRVDQRRAG